MGDSGIRRAVVAKLSALYPGVYTDNNIGLVGTHQHAGVGGFLEVRTLLFNYHRYFSHTSRGLIFKTSPHHYPRTAHWSPPRVT